MSPDPSHTTHKTHLKWITDLNVKSKTKIILQENTKKSLHDLHVDKYFLDKTQKGLTLKRIKP